MCVHSGTVCDMHPNPACIYKNKKGEMVSEDEEGCLEVYKLKGLVSRSANFPCQSKIHNKHSDAISIEDWKNQKHVVIGNGTTVQILATRCNGVHECLDDEFGDEYNCGFDTQKTFVFGKWKWRNNDTFKL